MEERKLKLAEEIISYIREGLIAAMPLMSHAILNLPVDLNSREISDGRKKRCGTDGKHIVWEADDLIRTFRNDPDNAGHIYMHMVIHCLFTHMYAYDRMDTETWDIACDIACEHVISLLNFSRLSLVQKQQQETVFEKIGEKAPDLTAEQIYSLLLNDVALKDLALEKAELFCFDDHSIWVIKTFSPLESNLTIYSQASEFFDEKKQWQQIYNTLSLLKEERSLYEGSMGGSQQIHLNDLTPAQKNYARILEKFALLKEENELDPDSFDLIFYTYGLSLYGDLPLIEPLEYREAFKIRELVIAIDTSGSCQGEKVREFLRNTAAILNMQKNFSDRFSVCIIQCDSKIQKENMITSAEDFERYMCDVDICGAGGTDFRPVFSHVDELISQGVFHSLQGLIFFTDGLGMYPEEEPPYKTLFIYPDEKERRHAAPLWAETCIM